MKLGKPNLKPNPVAGKAEAIEPMSLEPKMGPNRKTWDYNRMVSKNMYSFQKSPQAEYKDSGSALTNVVTVPI